MVACAACATELRADAKFCDECGAGVGPARSFAEYKQVTVLFADVVHSMDIAAAVGPERLRELMADVFDHCCDVVQRYGGTVDKFTGDGVMAVFGAPTALEDHAIRACMAALDIQQRVQNLAGEVRSRDGIELALRVGLNSGEVIAGEVGSRSASYTTIGDQVGMAQRMESVAMPGGVMVSGSTARLVEGEAALGERAMVQIKGADAPVPAYALLSITGRRPETTARTSTFVGREWEMSALSAMLDRSINGHGCVVSLVGPPGIGKSRTLAEIVSLAKQRRVQVFSTYCESHTSDVPFQAATRLLRSAWGVEGLGAEAARDMARSRVPGAHVADLVLLHDELGIRDSAEPLPDIAPEARRRRLTALVNASVMARRDPAVYVIEDAHWIDATSEWLLADFLSVVPQAHALALITYRPEYGGALSRSAGAQTIALAPLDDSQISGLVSEFLGPDPSVVELAGRVAERAAGNPFFAEEIVRDLADRKVLSGERGAYACADEAADVDVPATVQAAIAARIDRLGPDAKLTLNAAAVIGLRFGESLLAALADTAAMKSLLDAELIDQVAFTPRAEYAFRHPLIRSVAYRSQLASARAELHRSLASTLEARDPESSDETAALIAEHLESAGDLQAAFGWHMRAGGQLTFRDIVAARLSWQRARDVADRLPTDHSGREAMRIAPRTLLCASAFRVARKIVDTSYEELCQLTGAVGDKASLAAATSGQVATLVFEARYQEATQLASQLASLVDDVGDPVQAVMQLPIASMAKLISGEVAEGFRLAQRVIDLCDGDRYLGNLIVESPLTLAIMLRAAARMLTGADGWKQDMLQAAADCREFTPIGEGVVLAWRYGMGVAAGALRADAAAVRETAEVLALAEHMADDLNVESARFLHAFALVQQDGAHRAHGLTLLNDARQAAVEHRSLAAYAVIADVEFGRAKLRSGDVETAIDQLTSVFDREMASGGVFFAHSRVGEFLVEALLHRGSSADVANAHAVADRVAALPVEKGLVPHELPTLRARALLARADGDDEGYARYRDRYRARAHELDYEAHIDTAEAMD